MAAKKAAYEHGVKETKVRLTEEVAEACRDYCAETWNEVLNHVRVPANSELRKAESIFFPKHIRETPVGLPPTTALPLPLPE